MQHSTALVKKHASLFITILWAGLLVGTLDGTGATINFLIAGGKDAGRIFQYIASAVFKKEEAYSGKPGMIAIGILFHYIVAYSFTTFFFLVYPYIKWLPKNKLLVGILYGIFIWSVMTFLVLPLTKIPRGAFHFKQVTVGICILIMAIGIPLSYIASAYYRIRASD